MKLPAYPRTKPSGVDWLGDVPEHWEVKQLRHLTRFSYGDSLAAEDREDGPVGVFGSNGQVGTHVHRNTLAPVIVVGRKGSFGKVNFSDSSVFAIDTTYFIDRKQTKADLRWLSCLLRSLRLDTISKDSAVPGLAREDAYTNRVAVPPPAEQRSIAAFLDRETGRVDQLVAKKRELIERLKEKRVALISRAVTRGLPAEAAAKVGLPINPPLKPSGIDWIGDIPEHWKVMRFRRLVLRLDQGWSPNANNYPAAEDELAVLKLGAARKGRFYPEDNKALDDIPGDVIPITPASGDLLISRANTPDLVGDVCVVKGNYPNRIIPDLLYRLRLTADTNGDFVCWFLLSRPGRAQIECDARGSSGSMVKLGQGHVRAWSIPIPPLPEQAAIAAYLDEETAKLDALVGKVEEAVERLQEYRTALITAAVTGKIDVRKVRR